MERLTGANHRAVRRISAGVVNRRESAMALAPELAGEAGNGWRDPSRAGLFDLDDAYEAVSAGGDARFMDGANDRSHAVRITLDGGAERTYLELEARILDDLDGGIDVFVGVFWGPRGAGKTLDFCDHGEVRSRLWAPVPFRHPGRRGGPEPASQKNGYGKPDPRAYAPCPTAFLRTHDRDQVQGDSLSPKAPPAIPNSNNCCPL